MTSSSGVQNALCSPSQEQEPIIEQKQWATKKDWERNRLLITELYSLHQLPEVITEMEDRGFYATPRMYKFRFKVWGISKRSYRRTTRGFSSDTTIPAANEVYESLITAQICRFLDIEHHRLTMNDMISLTMPPFGKIEVVQRVLAYMIDLHDYGRGIMKIRDYIRWCPETSHEDYSCSSSFKMNLEVVLNDIAGSVTRKLVHCRVLISQLLLAKYAPFPSQESESLFIQLCMKITPVVENARERMTQVRALADNCILIL